MADAPKILGTDTLREAYPKLNSSIDNANEALTRVANAEADSTNAVATATEAKTTAETVRSEFDLVVAEAGSNNPEVVNARGTHALLKDRLNSVDAQLAENTNSVGVPLGEKLVGEVDDSPRFQRAIDKALLQSKKPIIKIPAGSFTVKNISHSSGVLYVGAGSGQTEIIHSNGYAEPLISVTGGTTGTPTPASPFFGFVGLTLKGGDQTTNLIWYEGQIDNQVKFHDLQFAGGDGTSATMNAISCRDYLNFHLSKIRFDGIGGWAIEIRNAQYFSHGSFSIDEFTWDNANYKSGVDTWGKGIFFIDTSGSSVEKGVISFSNGRVETNENLTVSKPTKSLFRFIQNRSRLDSNPPQIILSLENIAFITSSVAKDMKIVSCDYRDIVLNCRNVTSYGTTEFYNNDNGDAKNVIMGGVTTRVIVNTNSNPNRYDYATSLLQNKLLGMNQSVFDSDANRNLGVYERGDITYNNFPTNEAGRLGRSFAYKAIQKESGRHTLENIVFGNGSITAGSNLLQMPSIPNTMMPNTSVDIAGAGTSGSVLKAVVKSIDYNTNVVTISASAITTVSNAEVKMSVATLAVVDMVFYGTYLPTNGRYEVGDKLVITNASIGRPTEYQCVTAGTPGTWRMTKQTVRSFDTVNRPTGLTAAETGLMYIDNGKPIFWDGSVWKDATGTTV